MIHVCVMHLHVFLITSIVALLRNLNYVLYKGIGALNFVVVHIKRIYTELKPTKILIFCAERKFNRTKKNVIR